VLLRAHLPAEQRSDDAAGRHPVELLQRRDGARQLDPPALRVRARLRPGLCPLRRPPAVDGRRSHRRGRPWLAIISAAGGIAPHGNRTCFGPDARARSEGDTDMSGSSSVRIQQGTGDLIGTLPFDGVEYQGRLDHLRELMAARGLDALITFTPENMYYLTGHDSPGHYFYQATVVTQGHLPINVLRRAETTNTVWHSWPRLTVSYEDREDPIDLTVALLADLGVA